MTAIEPSKRRVAGLSLCLVAAIACLALGVFRHDEVPSQLGSSVAFEAAAQAHESAKPVPHWNAETDKHVMSSKTHKSAERAPHPKTKTEETHATGDKEPQASITEKAAKLLMQGKEPFPALKTPVQKLDEYAAKEERIVEDMHRVASQAPIKGDKTPTAVEEERVRSHMSQQIADITAVLATAGKIPKKNWDAEAAKASNSNSQRLARDLGIITSDVSKYSVSRHNAVPSAAALKERQQRSSTASASYGSHLSSQIDLITSGLDDGAVRDKQILKAKKQIKAQTQDKSSEAAQVTLPALSRNDRLKARAHVQPSDKLTFLDGFTHTAAEAGAMSQGTSGVADAAGNDATGEDDVGRAMSALGIDEVEEEANGTVSADQVREASPSSNPASHTSLAESQLKEQVHTDETIIKQLRLQHQIDVDSKLQHQSLISSLPTSNGAA